jgi:hypothetical protein
LFEDDSQNVILPKLNGVVNSGFQKFSNSAKYIGKLITVAFTGWILFSAILIVLGFILLAVKVIFIGLLIVLMVYFLLSIV